jgi:hypothetical protein
LEKQITDFAQSEQGIKKNLKRLVGSWEDKG